MIKVIYVNKTEKKFKSIDEIDDTNLVIMIDCSYNKLTKLPENMNYPSLQTFNCSHNKLTTLPENMNYPSLQTFNCSHNKLTTLPENMNFPNLQSFFCSYNKLTKLPETMLHFIPNDNKKIIHLSKNVTYSSLLCGIEKYNKTK